MEINYKKTLKLVTLLISALLIGTVSAQIYSYMYIEGSGTITSAELSWQLGATAPTGATIEGKYVKNLNLSIPTNTFKNFTDCLQLINDNATSITFGLDATVTGGNTTKFTTFDLVVYQLGGARVTKLSIKSQESKTGLTIQGSETLYVRFEVDPLLDEISGDVAFTVKLTYE